MWYNPTHVAEPHTVSFVSEQKYWANIEAPFVLSNATQFVSAIPGANAEPVVMDGPNGVSS